MTFKKGTSGNPAGRPKGIPNPQARLRALIADHVPSIIDRMVAEAIGGDTAAASLLLSRVLPPVKPETPAQAIPDSGGMVARAEEIVVQAMAGNLSSTAASELMAMISSQARVVETVELEQRIATIEERLNGK